MGFKAAPEIEEIAQGIIEEHYKTYPEMDITFRFLFSDKESKVKGKSVVGNARLLTGVAAYLALNPPGADSEQKVADFSEDDDTRLFLLTFWEEGWNKLKTHHQRKACVHRHLMRCEAFEETDEKDQTTITMRIKAFGIEAFPEEFELYGAWEEDMQEVADAIKGQPQLTLDYIETMPKVEPKTQTTTTPASGEQEQSEGAKPGTAKPRPKIPFESVNSGLTNPNREG